MAKKRKQAAVWQGFLWGGLLSLGVYLLGLLLLALLFFLFRENADEECSARLRPWGAACWRSGGPAGAPAAC